MSAEAIGLHMMLVQQDMEVEVGTIAPEYVKVKQGHTRIADQYPPTPPHHSGV